MKFEYYKDVNGRWRWRVTAGNGRIIGASSQGYSDKQDARKNAVTLQQNLLVFRRGGNL